MTRPLDQPEAIDPPHPELFGKTRAVLRKSRERLEDEARGKRNVEEGMREQDAAKT